MSKLLTGEELRKAISVYELQSIVPKGTKSHPEKIIITVGALLSTPDIEGLVELFNSQKRLYADMVIGKDKNTQYTEKEKSEQGEFLISRLRREAMENTLRAEQRERNK